MAKNNPFFRKSKRRAEQIISQPNKMKKLSKYANAKIYEIVSKRDVAKESIDYLRTLTRMVQAYANGRYQRVPWKTMVLVLTALIYFVWPIDLLPDFLPAIGLADDFAVLLYVLKLSRTDIEEFRQWEASQPQFKEEY